MSRDRFAELGNSNNSFERKGRSNSNGPSLNNRSRSNNNRGVGDGGGGGGGASFEQLSDSIKAAIERITRNTRELQKLHRKALVELQNNQAQALSRQLDSIVDKTGSLIQEARNSLKGLSRAPGGDPTVKQVQQKALARKLMDAAREYQSVQQAAKAQYRTQLERQFRIAKPNASSQEVRQALNSDGNVFQQQILSSRVGDQRRMLQDVQNRQHDLEKIEQSLVELFELMQEMQMILEQQQTFVNTIETNLDDTANNVELGSTELTKATESSRSGRKKKWIICGLCTGLIFILIVVVYIYVVSPALTAANAAKGVAPAPAPAAAAPAAAPVAAPVAPAAAAPAT